MELKTSHLLRRPPNITPVSEFHVILPVFFSRPRSAEQLMMSRYDQLGAKIVWGGAVVQSNQPVCQFEPDYLLVNTEFFFVLFVHLLICSFQLGMIN
jgi:hypothetical protein